MSQEQICPHCKTWILAPRDQYCGWCDMRFSGFEMELKPAETFYLREEKGKKEIDLFVHSSGRSGQLKILDIRADSDLVTVIDPPEPNKPVALTESKHWKLVVDFIRAKEALQEINVRVVSDLKADDAHKTKTIRLVPRPDFTVKVEKDLLLVLDRENREANQVTLALTRGWVTVKEIQTDKPWAKAAFASGGAPVVLRENDRKELPVNLSFNENAVMEEIDRGREATPLKLQLRVICEGMESKPFDLPAITIATQRPAKLFIDQVTDIPTGKREQPTRRCIKQEVFLKSRRRFLEFELTLRNKGDMPLQIERAALLKSETPNAIELPPWLEFVTSTILKAQIKKDDIRTATVRVDTQAMPEVERSYEFNLQFSCSGGPSGNDGVETVPLILDAKNLPNYQGIVAMDFGTTNTCVAVFDAETMTEPEPLILDQIGIGGSSSVPSVILYRRLLDGDVRYARVGSNANAYLGAPDTEESLITSIKREVGQPRPKLIRYYEDPESISQLKPEEIARDIINEILAEVEQKLKARVKVCAISHPVQYVHRRIEALERAFTGAGVVIDEKLTEPLAAALDYVFRNQHTARKSYKLMVWDFGGGTTDIAYLQVNVERAETGSHDIIVPELLGSDGDRRFGGDDVTAAIMRYFGGICREEIAKKSGPELFLDMEKIREITDRNARGMALLNYRTLLRFAEDAKIQVSNTGKDSAPASPQFSFWHEQKKLDFTAPPLVLSLAKLGELVGEMLENALAYMVELIEANNNVFPDVILLVGNSSRLPIVRQRIEELFGGQDCQILDAGSIEAGTIKRYKETVVIGLCRHCISRHEVSDVRVRPLQRRLVATSHIGIRKYSGGKLVFAPIIKKGGDLDKWYKLENVSIERKAKLSILSCTGRSLDLNDKRYIENIAQFPITAIAEKFSDEELQKAEYYLQVSSDEHVHFKVKVGEQESESFKAEIPIAVE